jgi:hypothetical protein
MSDFPTQAPASLCVDNGGGDLHQGHDAKGQLRKLLAQAIAGQALRPAEAGNRPPRQQ